MESGVSNSSTTSSTCRSSRRCCRSWRTAAKSIPCFMRPRPISSGSRSSSWRGPAFAIIQPGIESLDDNVLALIAKGNSALMNLQLLSGRANLVLMPHGTCFAEFLVNRRLVCRDGQLVAGDLSSAAADRSGSSSLRPLQSLPDASRRFRTDTRAEPDLSLCLSAVSRSLDAPGILIRGQRASETYASRIVG